MSDYHSRLSEKVQRQLRTLIESSHLPPGRESEELLAENWQTKERLFQEQIEALEMTEEHRFDPEDPRGALLLTYSGSLVTLGPYTEGGRQFEYASIKLRSDVPAIVKEEGVSLAGALETDQPARFSGSSVEHTSDLLYIRSFEGDVDLPEQIERLRQATIFLTNGFVKANQTLSLGDRSVPDQFTHKAMVQQVAERNGVTQKLARAIVDDYLSTVETGALLGERVPLGRLGKVRLGVRPAQKARVGRNPSTGDEMVIPAQPEKPSPRFSFSGPLKERAARIPVERIEEGE